MANKGELVPEEDWLYRRVLHGKKYVDKEGNATSRAFALREVDTDGLSVNAKSLRNANDSVGDKEKFHLFEISHVDVKVCGVQAFHDPIVDEDEAKSNPAHCLITGANFKIDNDIIPGLLAKRSQRVKF